MLDLVLALGLLIGVVSVVVNFTAFFRCSSAVSRWKGGRETGDLSWGVYEMARPSVREAMRRDVGNADAVDALAWGKAFLWTLVIVSILIGIGGLSEWLWPE